MGEFEFEIGDLVWHYLMDDIEFQIVGTEEINGDTIYHLEEYLEDDYDDKLKLKSFKEAIMFICGEEEIDEYYESIFMEDADDLVVSIPGGVIVPLVPERTDGMNMRLEELYDYMILYEEFGEEHYRERIDAIKKELTEMTVKE